MALKHLKSPQLLAKKGHRSGHLKLPCFKVHRADRSIKLLHKGKVGDVSIINKRCCWCTNSTKLTHVCSPHLECQQVTFPNRGTNTLDYDYTTMKEAYCAFPSAVLSQLHGRARRGSSELQLHVSCAACDFHAVTDKVIGYTSPTVCTCQYHSKKNQTPRISQSVV